MDPPKIVTYNVQSLLLVTVFSSLPHFTQQIKKRGTGKSLRRGNNNRQGRHHHYYYNTTHNGVSHPHSRQPRDQFLPLAMPTMLWIKTHQPWVTFVIHQSLTTTVVQIVLLSKSTLLPDEDLQCAVETSWYKISKWKSWDKRYLNPLCTLSTMINIFDDKVSIVYSLIIHVIWSNVRAPCAYIVTYQDKDWIIIILTLNLIDISRVYWSCQHV